jgi:drug/metabolite transporter (DMT)-like permease
VNAAGHPRALGLLILGAALIGLVPIGVRLCGLHPLAVGFWRFALAVPVLWWWSRAVPARSSGAPRRRLLGLAGLLFACDIACFFIAIRDTSVANATLLSNCAPVFVAIGVALSSRGLPSRLALAAAGIAVLGVALLVGDRLEAGHLLGDALGLVSALFYGCYQLAIAALRRDQPAVRVMLWVACVGALTLGSASLAAGVAIVPTSARDWALLVGLAWVTQIGGQGLITWAMAHLAPVFSSVVLLVQPLVAVGLAWWLFADGRLGPAQGAGALLVIAGIVLAKRAQDRSASERLTSG